MSCGYTEERMSDFIEGGLPDPERSAVTRHLEECRACSELMAHMVGVIEWGKSFPVLEAPAWLASRIIANTPQQLRETWLETLRAGWHWLISPRISTIVFSTALVLGWIGNRTGMTPLAAELVRNPVGVYDAAGDWANRAYDQAVRRYYNAPVVARIQSRIERFREIS